MLNFAFKLKGNAHKPRRLAKIEILSILLRSVI